MSTEIGRLSADERSVVHDHDAPEKAVAAILTKQDEIIDKLNSILAAVEAATDGNSLFTALDVADIKATLSKVQFKL